MKKAYTTPTAVATGYVTANTDAIGSGSGDVDFGKQALSVTSVGFGL